MATQTLTPSQQTYRDKALGLIAYKENFALSADQYIALAQVYATLAVSEALIDGYTGESVGELLGTRKK